MSALPSRVQLGASKGCAELSTTCRRPVAHVEDLEDASDVVAVGHEALLRGPDDPHVAEDGPLDDVRVVRAEEEADVDLVAQGQIGELARGEGVAEARDGHGVGVALPLELDDVGAG